MFLARSGFVCGIKPRSRSLFLPGITILWYFGHSVVPTPALLLLGDGAEAVPFDGEISLLVVWRGEVLHAWNCSRIKLF